MRPGEATAATAGRPMEHRHVEARPGEHRGERDRDYGERRLEAIESEDNGQEREVAFGSHEQLRDETEAAVPSSR
jgi:hypothetical protein